MLRLILGAVYTYVGVDVDLGRRFAGEPDELARVQLPHHHFAGFLDSAERLRRALVITVLHRLNLAEDFVGDPAHLKTKRNWSQYGKKSSLLRLKSLLSSYRLDHFATVYFPFKRENIITT